MKVSVFLHMGSIVAVLLSSVICMACQESLTERSIQSSDGVSIEQAVDAYQDLLKAYAEVPWIRSPSFFKEVYRSQGEFSVAYDFVVENKPIPRNLLLPSEKVQWVESVIQKVEAVSWPRPTPFSVSYVDRQYRADEHNVKAYCGHYYLPESPVIRADFGVHLSFDRNDLLFADGIIAHETGHALLYGFFMSNSALIKSWLRWNQTQMAAEKMSKYSHTHDRALIEKIKEQAGQSPLQLTFDQTNLLRQLSSAHQELFADLVAAVTLNDPDHLVDILLQPPLVELRRVAADKNWNRDVHVALLGYRRFSSPHDMKYYLSKYEYTDKQSRPYSFFAPLRDPLWQWYQQYYLDRPRVFLTQVATALMHSFESDLLRSPPAEPQKYFLNSARIEEKNAELLRELSKQLGL